MEKLALFGKEKPLINYLNPLKEIRGFEKIALVFPETNLEETDFIGGLIEYPNQHISSIIENFTNLPLLIIYNSKTISDLDLGKLFDICEKEINIKGLIDSEVSLTFHLPVLREAFLGIHPNKILGNVLSKSLLELERIKEIHKKMVPIRSGSNNGITYYSKFSSGESTGGEFFDFQNKNLGNMFFFFFTDSYQISNLLLSAYQSFDFENFNLEEFGNFIGSINSDKIDLNKNKLEILIASIDRKNLKVEGYNFSSCKLFSSEEIPVINGALNKIPPENLKSSIFSFKVGRGERLYIFSSGYLRNMEKYYPGFEIKPFLSKVNKLPAGDALNEFFFHMKRKVEGKFPFWDSSVIIIEVDKNVLVQV
jgi:hypothetical protein